MSTTTAKPVQKTAPKKLALKDITEGDVFSELSHFTSSGKKGTKFLFKHHASGQEIELGASYIENYLNTANQWTEELEVGKEDKFWTAKQIEEALAAGELPKDVKLHPREGDVRIPGIRSIWENIHSSHVLSVCYQKQGKALSVKKLKELQDAQIASALEAIDMAQKNKTGVAKTASSEMKKIQANPIIPYEDGEMRTLVGYKVQFTSRDGRYNCVDMNITPGEGNVRPVNINTISWLVFEGVKYIVK